MVNKYQQNDWMIKHGKESLIGFTKKEKSVLKKYFQHIDFDKSGSISLQELEEICFSLGMVNSVKEVEDIMKAIDQDSDGQLEFDEFLLFIKKSLEKGTQNKKSVQFFFDLINGNMPKDQKMLDFQLLVSNIRRSKFIDGFMSKDQEKKKYGQKLIKNYQYLLESFKN